MRAFERLGLKASSLEKPGAETGDSSVKAHQRKDGTALSLSISSQQIEFDGRNADLVAAFDLSQRLEGERQLQEKAKSGNALLDAAARAAPTVDFSKPKP